MLRRLCASGMTTISSQLLSAAKDDEGKSSGKRGLAIEWEELHSIVARVPRHAAERASGRAAAMRGRELHHAVARMRRAAGCNRRKGDLGANEIRRDGGAQDGLSVPNAAHVH